jgi:hypothetical protein
VAVGVELAHALVRIINRANNKRRYCDFILLSFSGTSMLDFGF